MTSETTQAPLLIHLPQRLVSQIRHDHMPSECCWRYVHMVYGYLAITRLPSEQQGRAKDEKAGSCDKENHEASFGHCAKARHGCQRIVDMR